MSIIKTSFFGNIKNCENPVSISAYYPRFLGVKIPTIKDLSPSRKILNQFKIDGDIEKYTEQYISQLELIPVDFFKTLYGKTLLCYEGRNDFCHRRIFAFWYEEKFGEVVDEI